MVEENDREVLVENEDYYFENGLMVLTSGIFCVADIAVSKDAGIVRTGM